MRVLQKSGIRSFGDRKGTHVSNNNTLMELEELAGFKDTTSGMRSSPMAIRERDNNWKWGS